MATGQVAHLGAVELHLPEFAVDVDSEREQLRQALAELSAGIASAIDNALRRGRSQTAQSCILAAHLALVSDPDLRSVAEGGMAAGHSVSHAFRQAVLEQC